MNKIEVIKNSIVISACYKKVEETASWIAQCESELLWGAIGTYTIQITDATVELENIRAQKELVSKNTLKNCFQNNSEIQFSFAEPQNTVTASLTSSGASAGTYNNVTIDSKGRVTSGFNSDVINRFSYVTTINQVNSAATYANVSQLVTANLPAGLYRMVFFALMQTGSTTSGTGVRVAPSTASITTIGIKWFISQAVNTTSANFQYEQKATADNLTSASAAAANTNFTVSGEGVFRISVAGSVAIQIRPENAGTACTIRPDAIFLLEKIL